MHTGIKKKKYRYETGNACQSNLLQYNSNSLEMITDRMLTNNIVTHSLMSQKEKKGMHL